MSETNMNAFADTEPECARLILHSECLRVVNQRDSESQQHNRRFAELQNQYQALESKYKFVQKHCMDIEQKLKQLTRKYSLIIPEYPCQTTVIRSSPKEDVHKRIKTTTFQLLFN
eukprot:921987_1